MSDSTPKDFPAFPVEQHPSIVVTSLGMTLRDYFAAKAMQALLTASGGGSRERVAHVAYLMADVMLKEREQ